MTSTNEPQKGSTTWRPMSTAPADGKTQIVAKHRPNEHTPDGWIATITIDPQNDDARRGGRDTIIHYNGDRLQGGFHGLWTGWLYPHEVGLALTTALGPASPTGDLRAHGEAIADEVRIAMNMDAEARIARLEATLPFDVSKWLTTICAHVLGLYDASEDSDVRDLAIAIKACAADLGEAVASRIGATPTPDLGEQGDLGNGRAARWIADRIEAAHKIADAHPEGSGNRSFYRGQATAYENALGALTRSGDLPAGSVVEQDEAVFRERAACAYLAETHTSAWDNATCEAIATAIRERDPRQDDFAMVGRDAWAAVQPVWIFLRHGKQLPEDLAAMLAPGALTADGMRIAADPTPEMMAVGGRLIEEGVFDNGDPNDTVFDGAGRVWRAMFTEGATPFRSEPDHSALREVAAGLVAFWGRIGNGQHEKLDDLVRKAKAALSDVPAARDDAR